MARLVVVGMLAAIMIFTLLGCGGGGSEEEQGNAEDDEQASEQVETQEPNASLVPEYEVVNEADVVLEEGVESNDITVDTEASSEEDLTLIAEDIRAQYADWPSITITFVKQGDITEGTFADLGLALIANTPEAASIQGITESDSGSENDGLIVVPNSGEDEIVLDSNNMSAEDLSAMTMGEGTQYYKVAQSDSDNSCDTITSTRVTQRVTEIQQAYEWYVRQRMDFCHLSTTKAYIKGVRFDYWVPQGEYVKGGALEIFNNETIVHTFDGRYYEPLSSNSNYAGGVYLRVNKWAYDGQANGRWTTITEYDSYWGLGMDEWNLGYFSLAQYK